MPPVGGEPARGREVGPEDLARAAQAGDAAAFDELVRRFQGAVHGFLLLRTASPQDAAELTQETFLLAWRKLDRYRPELAFSTWIFTLARRLASSARRRAARRPRADPLGELAVARDPGRDLGEREERAQLWALAQRVLTPDQLSALWLRYAEELPARDVARILGRRPGGARALLFRARETLARHLDPRFLEGERPLRAPTLCAPPPRTR